MWAKEPTTVGGNLREVKKLLEKESVLGYPPESLVVPAGPFPSGDDQLMLVASTMMMLRLLDAGKNEPCVQYNTVRPMRKAISNQCMASLNGQTVSVMMRGTTKLITSTCSTNGEWFERFMLGYHKRVGDVSRPDLTISIEVMVALMVRFDRLWLVGGDGPSQEKVLFPALFAISTYTGGLRGEETPLMDLHATAKHYQEGINHPKHPHVVMALRGRFINEVGELEHLKPLAVETKLGLKVGIWFKRMLSWYEARGVTRGPVFRDSRGNRAQAGRYELAISPNWSGCKS